MSNDLLERIGSFELTSGDWETLDGLFREIQKSGITRSVVEAILRLFESCPGVMDASGLVSDAVHLIEQYPAYLPLLIESIKRVPSYLALELVERLLIFGSVEEKKKIGDSLVEGYRSPQTTRSIRDSIREVVHANFQNLEVKLS